MLERAELQELVSQGLSDQEVADKVGVSSRTVLRWRTRYRIASQWTPPLSPHGTTARYKSGCKCPDCRAANADQHRSWALQTTRATAATATRQWARWTPEEDSVVLAHTPREAAELLSRSWSACVNRRLLLRAQEVATA